MEVRLAEANLPRQLHCRCGLPIAHDFGVCSCDVKHDTSAMQSTSQNPSIQDLERDATSQQTHGTFRRELRFG